MNQVTQDRKGAWMETKRIGVELHGTYDLPLQRCMCSLANSRVSVGMGQILQEPLGHLAAQAAQRCGSRQPYCCLGIVQGGADVFGSARMLGALQRLDNRS